MRRTKVCVVLACVVGVLSPPGLQCQSRLTLEALAGISGSLADNERGSGLAVEASALRTLGHGTKAVGVDLGYLGGGSTPEITRIGILDPFDPMPGDTILVTESSKLATWYVGLAYRMVPNILKGRMSFRLGFGAAKTINTHSAEFLDLSGQPLPFQPPSSSTSGWGAFGKVGIDVALARIARSLEVKLGADAFVLTVGEGATTYLRGGIGLRIPL